MRSKKLKYSGKGRASNSVVKAAAWARANPHEWDFSKVKPEERPMAVAWEYGREKIKLFSRFRSFLAIRDRKRLRKIKKPLETLHGNGLSHIFLTFWKSPHWPKRPFLDLSSKEKKEAFPKVFHEDSKTTSAEILGIVQDVTPHLPFERKSWRHIHKHFDLEDYILCEIENPVKRVLLVDMNQAPGAILKSFKDHLFRAGLKQGRGRSTIEKDLLALTVHRLFPKFRTFKAMDAVLGSSDSSNASVLAMEHNRAAHWNYAQCRLGRGWGRKAGKSKNARPIFQFSRVDADYEDID
jgi:hypothetical protein